MTQVDFPPVSFAGPRGLLPVLPKPTVSLATVWCRFDSRAFRQFASPGHRLQHAPPLILELSPRALVSSSLHLKFYVSLAFPPALNFHFRPVYFFGTFIQPLWWAPCPFKSYRYRVDISNPFLRGGTTRMSHEHFPVFRGEEITACSKHS